MKFTERRQCKRYGLNGTSRVLPATELDAVAYQAIDVSACGVGVIGARPLERNADCMVSFDLFHEGEQKRINAHGKVVALTPAHSGQYRIGIRFADMDSRSRQLLESLEQDSFHPAFCCGVVSRIND